ncbi:HutD family protein [Bartonella sp. HY329]|uniref:HutD/Ves family protein n=1 Tax=unclassified Bartonella TaxID=2645622 RepID=UPI0021CADDC2|nr:MULTISPECIES: HutD family protein [unclassified Bartonella]UXM95367.1 HutD family protein [Bartonella sp. HY329]UXN09692.1 HutD family protein [Bartonella sp. HY328]
MKHIKASDYKVMPWKNGGGETREVAFGNSEKSTQQAPDWRVSIATISKSGPFSTFPDIDRTIALIKGDDVVLTINDMDNNTGKIVLNQNGDCYSFIGEAKVYAEVSGGASTDLNIMTNRHYFQHHMQRLNQPLPPLNAAQIIKIFLVATAGTDLTIGEKLVALGELDTLIFDGGDVLDNLPQNANVIAIFVMNNA